MIFISLHSAYAQPVKITTITGQFGQTGNVKMIYLDSLSQRGSEDYAAAEVNSEGRFELKAPITSTNIFKLRVDDNNYLMLILSPGESLQLFSPSNKLGVDARISGSPQTELLYSTINALRPFEMKRDSLNKVYNTVLASPSRDSLSSLIIKEFMTNDSLQKVMLTNQVEKMPGSIAWIFLQDKFDMSADFVLIDKMEKAMYTAYPENVYVKQFHQQVEVERKTSIGAVAPDISLSDPEGNIRKLSSLKGKVVLVDFWASWCGPCRKENPNVVKAYNTFKDKGFEIYSVSLDKDRDSWLKAIATDKLIWPNHVSDLKYWKSEGAAAYGVTSIPFTVLLNKEGKIVAKKLRGDALEAKLAELLN